MQRKSAIMLVCLLLLIVPVIYFVYNFASIVYIFLTRPNPSLIIGNDGNLVLLWGGVPGMFHSDVLSLGNPILLVLSFLGTVAFILLLVLLQHSGALTISKQRGDEHPDAREMFPHLP